MEIRWTNSSPWFVLEFNTRIVNNPQLTFIISYFRKCSNSSSSNHKPKIGRKIPNQTRILNIPKEYTNRYNSYLPFLQVHHLIINNPLH